MGFFELLVIAVVTLVLVGPERMPGVVRSVALTVGRIKRSFNSAKRELEKHIGADEIRRQLHNEEIMQSLKATRDEMEAMLKHEHALAAKQESESENRISPESTEEPTDPEEEKPLKPKDTKGGQSE